MLVKIHSAYRDVIAICDKALIGKRFESNDRKMQLDLTGNFFKGEEKTRQEVENIIRIGMREDAVFNIVGPRSCELAKELGLIDEKGIKTIEGVPFVLSLL